MKGRARWAVNSAVAALTFATAAWAQSKVAPHDRLTEVISEGSRVTLAGSVHPALAKATQSNAVDPGFAMEHMILQLQPDAVQQAALANLVAEQQDPRSAQYRKFLTPEQFATQFGASQSDIEKIAGWLRSHGFTVEEVSQNHLNIVFSGTAAAVQSAFKTEVREYRVNGEIHHANASEVQIPLALAGVVGGVVKMHDFHSRPFSSTVRPAERGAQPLFNGSGGAHYLAPADWAMIYDVRGLYTGGLSGQGQSIAVVGRSDVNASDIAAFRSQFGLPAGQPQVIVAQGGDPGFTGNGDAVEATLDVEWAGAIAPQASVKFVVSASTSSADGVDLAALYAVNHNVAPILSVSFGSCEADMLGSGSPTGGSSLSFYNSLWQQAASQGMSVFVSAGDSGAAGCDSASATYGTKKAVNGICSSPYATCVGGTEFNEGANSSLYWLPGNNAVLGTAQGYIPETSWNESGANGGSELAATGGGASIQWPKPSWQTGTGVPADGHRDVPDISVSAAGHDAYLIFFSGQMAAVGGTSAASPSLASLFALINQKYNSAQGNVNPALYPLASKQAQGGAKVFHDITTGNNTVPGVAGYAAGVGYDQTTGLGSVDGLQLVNHWRDVSLNGTFTLTAAPTSVTVQAGQNSTATLTVVVSNGFNWPVTFAVSGVPQGVVASFSSPSLTVPGSGTSLLQFAAGIGVASGNYNVTVTATGGNITQTATIALTVKAIPPACTLTPTPTQVSIGLGSSTNVRLSCLNPQGAIPGNLSLSVSGQPAGVSASFSPATVVPGTATSSLVINATTSAKTGSFTLAVTASSGTFSTSVNVPVTLTQPPSFALTAASTALTLLQGASTTVKLTAVHGGAFNSAIAFSVIGLPAGISGTFSPATLAAPGDGSSTLTLSASGSAIAGKYSLQVMAAGGGLSNTIPIALTVNQAPGFTVSTGTSALLIQAGGSAGKLNLTVNNLSAGFNSAVTFSLAGLPAGVTASFAPASLAAPGSGTSVLSLTAASTAKAAQSVVVVSANGGSVTRSFNVLLTVMAQPSYTLAPDVTSVALTSGATLTTGLNVVAQNGFNAPVTVKAGTLPAGITVSFSSTTINGTNGRISMTIQTGASLPAGNYSLSVTGTAPVSSASQTTQTATIKLLMGTVQTTLGASSLTMTRSGSASTTITATGTNYSGNVALSVIGLPVGVNYTMTPATLPGSGQSNLIISAGASAKPGDYTVTVRTAAGGTVAASALQLIID